MQPYSPPFRARWPPFVSRPGGRDDPPTNRSPSSWQDRTRSTSGSCTLPPTSSAAPRGRRALTRPTPPSLPAGLVGDGTLRVRNGRLLWAGREAPAPSVDIRTSGGPPFTIVDEAGTAIGTGDENRVYSQCHPGAVYLHQGDGFVIESLDVEGPLVRAQAGEVDFYTQPEENTDIDVVELIASGNLGRFGHRLGTVEVENRVVGFKRKRVSDRSVLAYEPLDLPPRRFTTQAVWFTMDDPTVRDAGIAPADLPGTLHAAAHTATALLPLFAICDRWDIGGLSTVWHPYTNGPVWFIYDGYPGGAGIGPLAHQAGARHLRATLQALRGCPRAARGPAGAPAAHGGDL